MKRGGSLHLYKALLSEQEGVQGFLQEAMPDNFSPHESPTIGPILLSGLDHAQVVRLAEAFRQVLLSSVPGWAVTEVKLSCRRGEGGDPSSELPVLHKYAYIPGIVENVREIVGNLQKGVFRLREDLDSFPVDSVIISDIPVSSHYKEFLLGEFFEEDESEMVLNPEEKVFTFQDRGFHIRFEFTIKRGVGYRRAEALRRLDAAGRDGASNVLLLTLDANFNPVRKVGYRLEKEGLFFHIQTNGALTAFEAYEKAFAIFRDQLTERAGGTP